MKMFLSVAALLSVQSVSRWLTVIAVLIFGGPSFSLHADSLEEWTLRNPLPTAEVIESVTFNNDLWVAVGSAGTILTGSDARNWTNLLSPTLAHLNSVASGDGVWVAVGAGGAIITSTNGRAWRLQTSGTFQELRSVAYGSGMFVGVGTRGAIVTSADGFNWVSQQSPTSNTLESVTFGRDTFVAVGGVPAPTLQPAHSLLTSLDGRTWVDRSAAAPQSFYQWGVTYGRGLFVSVGYNGAMLTSPDGINWGLSRPGWSQLYGVAFLKDRFVAIANWSVGFNDRSRVLTSLDGLAWTTNASASSYGEELHGLGYGNNTFILTGRKRFLTSTDGQTWERQRKDNTELLSSVAYGNGTFVAANGSVLTSPDGQSWTARATPDEIRTVGFGSGIFVASSLQSILTSPDGIQWTRRWQVEGELSQPFINGTVVYGNGIFLAGGDLLLRSIDGGVTWQRQLQENLISFRAMAFGNNVFVALDTMGHSVWTSADGMSWTEKPMMTPYGIWRLAYGNGRFVAVGGWEGKDATFLSSDGLNWTPGAFLNPNLTRVGNCPMTYGNGLFAMLAFYEPVAVCLTSPDGLSWAMHPIHTEAPFMERPFLGIAYGNNSFVGVGEFGKIFQSGPVTPPYQAAAQVECDLASVPGKESGSIRISRTGSTALGIDLTVHFSLSGTAQNGVDYQALSNSVVIPAGQTSVTIPVVAQGTLATAATKTMILTLAPGEAYRIGAPGPAVVTVENPGPYPRLRRSGTSRSADGTVHLTVDSPVGAIVAVETSADLVRWFPFTQITNATGTAALQHVPPPNAGSQFYRATLR